MTFCPLISILVSHKIALEAPLCPLFPSSPRGHAEPMSAEQHATRVGPFTLLVLLFSLHQKFLVGLQISGWSEARNTCPWERYLGWKIRGALLNKSCTFQRHLLQFSLYAPLVFRYRLSIIYFFGRRRALCFSYRNMPFNLSYAYSVAGAAGWHRQIRTQLKNLAFPETFVILFPPVLSPSVKAQGPAFLRNAFQVLSLFLMKEDSWAEVWIGRVNVRLHLGWHVAKHFSNTAAGCCITRGCVSHYIVILPKVFSILKKTSCLLMKYTAGLRRE